MKSKSIPRQAIRFLTERGEGRKQEGRETHKGGQYLQIENIL